jgi:hypothetical protein
MTDLLIALVIAVALLLLALTSTIGAAITLAWIGEGLWRALRTQSRGWEADIAFVFTWPLHWILER